MIKTGSTVKHIPSGEEWTLIGVNEKKNQVCAAGYPPSIAKLSDCELVEEGIGITRLELLYRIKEFGYDWD